MILEGFFRLKSKKNTKINGFLVLLLFNRKAKKKEFSRRRAFDDQNIDFIDERNRVFNNKIKRHFSVYTQEIKANLERGTAL